jgi:hypothetical protein
MVTELGWRLNSADKVEPKLFICVGFIVGKYPTRMIFVPIMFQ